ncbi:MAG: P27 family phage terminase small subunit [Solirubrobacterales bacterium]
MASSRPIPPPDEFPKDMRVIWHAAQRQLRLQGTWENTDCQLLESYVRAILTARRAAAAAADRPFVEGSRGQLVAHPAVKAAAEAERDACRFAQALLLTPDARRRHEVKTPEHEPFLDNLVG